MSTPAAALRSPTGSPGRETLAGAVRNGLERAASIMRSQQLPVPVLAGKLLRPTVAYALVPPDRRPDLDDRFWLGALAIQMVHEASLLHDDVIDQAAERRGGPTVYASRGVGPAVVLGDHLLTASYRAALWTRSPEFLERFITSVERTVAGEVRQGSRTGEAIDLDAYFDAILGKSGELFRASAALGASLLGLDRLSEREDLGLELGALYQLVDDLLDYCPAAPTGKDALKDYEQKKWTWVLAMADIDGWDLGENELLDAMFSKRPGSTSPAERAMVYLEVRREALLQKASDLVPGDDHVARVVGKWIDASRAGVEAQIEALRRSGPSRRVPSHAREDGTAGRRRERPSAEGFVVAAAKRLDGPEAWHRYFRDHARTFSFAARLFPPDERAKVEALYAWCRFTDDLVDRPGDGNARELGERLRAWRALSREAHDQGASEIPLLDAVMGDAARAGVDWLYPRALLEGVAMDLVPRVYEDWADLSRYTFCVAGAVGGWMTRLFGVHDADTLGRAHALGRAMQLTNILRDVGEDLAVDRVYLPRSLLRKHGITVRSLKAWRRSSGPLPDAHADAMRELVAVAEERYAFALPGIPSLPPFFARPVAVAAAAYRGIHDEVRRNGYDNLRRRARTSLARKVWLGARGLTVARRLRGVAAHPEGSTT